MSEPKHSLEINTELARRILTDFIRQELQRAGFQKAIIGVSGGIDSALSCYLAAEALGPDNVLALRMPYQSSSPDSFEHGGLVIEACGVQELTVDITPMVDPLLQAFPEADPVRSGNVMARMRMIVLYDQSAAFNGLVIGTSNKTEILLGYSTQFGDSAAAINPLGDLYKTQLRQLARALDVPQPILDKAPSADLWRGQTDENELGFTYERVDRLLLLLVDGRYSVQNCVKAGFEQDFVQQIISRMQRTHYKRLMPPIAKLSNRTVGYDFLYLRDWGT